jgi:hypothetical protein
MPTTHILSLIRPVFWGHYFLDPERGYSWQWNFKIFPFLIVSFLLLMLFTKNNFLLSSFGSVWLLLSASIQWWSITTEMFTFGGLAVLSFIYILYSKNLRLIAVNGVLFVLSSYSFIMVLYPAYQVPLVYFLLALLIGYFIKNKNEFRLSIQNNLIFKVLTLGLCLLTLLYFLVLFYHETKETIGVMANTVYPGKRNELGGNFLFLKMFTDNYHLFSSEFAYPKNWENICELSSFIMLSPIASVIIIADFIKNKKADALFIAVIIFQAFILCWLFIGFPEFLAKASLMNTSPTVRTIFVFGFSNVVITLLFLAHYKGGVFKNNLITGLGLFAIILLLSYGINYALNKQAMFFFSPMQVLIATAIFSVLNWLVVYYHKNRIYKIAFIGISFLVLIPNIKINPLCRGLAPYYDNALFKTVSAINAKDPGVGWAVFGQYTVSEFLKAAGINCFSGTQFTPPLKKLEFLDPGMKNKETYNRYAHIAFTTFIDGRDSTEFMLFQTDVYAIHMDPCSPRLYQLGIKYFLFTYEPQPVEVEYMNPVIDTLGYFIYKRIDI